MCHVCVCEGMRDTHTLDGCVLPWFSGVRLKRKLNLSPTFGVFFLGTKRCVFNLGGYGMFERVRLTVHLDHKLRSRLRQFSRAYSRQHAPASGAAAT